MEEFPPPQEGYDPKLQEVVPQLGPDDLAVAAEAAANAASDMQAPEEVAAPAPVMGDSLPAFSEFNEVEGQVPAPAAGMQPTDGQPGAENGTDAFLQPPQGEQYEGQYTSTDVPVPPMMDWNNNEQHVAPAAAGGTAPAPANQTMNLHSPIHAPAEASTAPGAPNGAEQQPAPAAPAPGEPVYTSYAIPPGQHPMHGHPPAPHVAAMPPHHYDPNAHHYAQWPVYGSPQGVMPPYAAAPPPRPAQNPHHNSNFWLQEEEERFLLGLRLYGWGQWKRIQTVVQTRSNKQIKSHAQKREKVNPEIKFKYAKGKSRRGRISSKEEGVGPSNSPYKDETNLALDDPSLPPMEELWKDVYGTNNGVGPNSRLRRYRSNALHQKWLEEVADKPESETQVATEKIHKEATKEPKKKLTPEGQYIHEHKLLERQPHAPHQPSPGPPMYYNPPPHHYHPGYGMPPPGVSPPRLHPPPGQHYPPPPAYHHQPPVAMHHAPPHQAGPTVLHPPTVHKPQRDEEPATPSTPSALNDESLRPGMRVYGRSKNGATWAPGVIYSAKVDPNKAIDASQASVPLVYHVQYDAGEEDPEVQEEFILSRTKYEKALDDLEAHYDLIMGRGKSNTQLDAGTPVYAQWIERLNPTSHARWLPGTVGSVHEQETPSGKVQMYHILFDNSSEKTDVTSECVLDRNEYHELVKHKHHYQQADPSRMPISDIYNLFSRGDPNAAGGQGMDLLFTASQMAAPMDTSKKRADPVSAAGEDPAAKRIKTEEGEKQQQDVPDFSAHV